MGLLWNEPNVDHRCVYAGDAFCAICSFRLLHPPASTNPRIGIKSAPAQIKMNCNTSLKIAERNPPSATYTATVSDETHMLKLIFQPSTTFMTSAMEYMLMPLISTVMNANEIAARVRLDSPNRSLR